MRATQLLCDHAVVAEGKLYISGAGWSVTGPDPAPSAIALKLDVPWDLTNLPIEIRLRLPSRSWPGSRSASRPASLSTRRWR